MTSRTIDPGAGGVTPAGAGTLLCAAAVRDRAERLLVLAQAGRLDDWAVDLERLAPTADFVAGVVRARYPELDVPLHSRWRHLVFAGRNLWHEIDGGTQWESSAARARAAFDLIVTSVLMDAGAGAAWRFQDPVTGKMAVRSEGLALASLRWFESGALSDAADEPYRVDAAALQRLDLKGLQHAFQTSAGNPLLGLDGRAALLNRFGTVMTSRPDLFAIADSPRPGGLFDCLAARAVAQRLPAASILETVLEALGPIWQSRPTLDGMALGDCWPHPALAGGRIEDSYVPLHKLSQWLSYSLIEPLQDAGITVCGVEELTGLAEYRNGGLIVDMQILTPLQPAALSKTYAVADPFVVGWRSLTVALLDRLAPLVGTRLGLTPDAFPLARLLEGGTWAAGRLIARETRSDGGPPFHITSDGTVF